MDFICFHTSFSPQREKIEENEEQVLKAKSGHSSSASWSPFFGNCRLERNCRSSVTDVEFTQLWSTPIGMSTLFQVQMKGSENTCETCTYSTALLAPLLPCLWACLNLCNGKYFLGCDW